MSIATPDSLLAVGLDGAPDGWLGACLYTDASRREERTELKLFGDLNELANFRERAGGEAAVAIDVPIGLCDVHHYRPCDLAARELLRWPRNNSVFRPMARYMLEFADDHKAANRLAKERGEPGVGSTNIMRKTRDVDAWVRARRDSEAWLWECHPELSFMALAGGEPLAADKYCPAGVMDRLRLVGQGFPDAAARLAGAPYPQAQAAHVDALDAYAALSTAVRCARREQTELGGERDSAGLVMRMAL